MAHLSVDELVQGGVRGRCYHTDNVTVCDASAMTRATYRRNGLATDKGLLVIVSCFCAQFKHLLRHGRPMENRNKTTIIKNKK